MKIWLYYDYYGSWLTLIKRKAGNNLNVNSKKLVVSWAVYAV